MTLRADLKRDREGAEATSADLFSAVFDNAAIGIAIVDMHGRPVMANPALERMLGYTAEQLQRMTFTDFTHPDDAAADWGMFEELLRGERDAYTMEKRYIRADGRVVWGHLTVSLIRDEAAGPPRYVIGMVEDITVRKEIETRLLEAEERYRNLVERLPAVVYVNAAGGTETALYISPAYERMFGFTPEERLADPHLWRSRLHPDDRQRVLREAALAEERREPFSTEYRYLRKDGRVVWVREEGAIITDDAGNPLYWQGVLLDITQAKEAEAALERTLDSLRRSHEERLRLVSRLVDAQEEERRRIGSDIHDDTIQKLTAVSMRLETLAREHAQLTDDPKFARLSEAVGSAIARLRALVFDLRPPALDRGLAAAIHWYVEEQRRIGNQGVEVSVRSDLRHEPDELARTTAYRIVREAISNARKHASASRVDVTLAERDGGLVVRVADDGVGLAAAPNGAGAAHFGLADMRDRAELAGGTLEIRSTPGGGTVVEAWLPSGPADDPR